MFDSKHKLTDELSQTRLSEGLGVVSTGSRMAQRKLRAVAHSSANSCPSESAQRSAGETGRMAPGARSTAEPEANFTN